MPTLHLKISPPQIPQRHHQLAEALTRLTAQHLSKRAEVTAVMVEDLPAARWFVGGKVVMGATAFLEISVTQGTNTPAQKAAFIEAAFAELQTQLCGADSSDDAPRLEPASYVIVRDLPATDWGYSGQTQAARSALKSPVPG
jgi:4-oxalocrotonate tautomerase